MNILQGAIVGLASGLAVAVGGAIKDAPHEGFSTIKFIRSPAIATLEGLALAYVFPTVNIPILFFATIGTERATTEGYKVVRAKVPMKFKYGEWGIPKKHIRKHRL